MSVEDLTTIADAARRVRMNHLRLRQRCLAAGIAIRWGGSERHPRIKVRMADVERMILGDRVLPQPRRRHRGSARMPVTNVNTPAQPAKEQRCHRKQQ